MFGETLDNLTANDLEVAPGVGTLSKEHPLLSSGGPSNQEILDATKAFYKSKRDLIDTSAVNAQDVAKSHRGFVSGMNGYTGAMKDKKLPPSAVDDTSNAIFGDDSDGGIFGPTLDKVKADQLFTTIALGVSVEAVMFVGGIGGLGCCWDIAKREGAKGYGYATGELGFKVEVDINVQAAIFNLMPSELDCDIFGMTVGAAYGLALTFAPFYRLKDNKMTILGYSVSVGVGFGGGASVFGGHLWNFG